MVGVETGSNSRFRREVWGSKMARRIAIPREKFDRFRDFCNFFLQEFGLKSWRISYEFKDLGGDYAKVEWDRKQRCATFTLSTISDVDFTEERLLQAAFHEVRHIVLGPLTSLAEQKDGSENQVDEACHAVICRDENVFFYLFIWSN